MAISPNQSEPDDDSMHTQTHLYPFFGRARTADFYAGHYPNGFLYLGNLGNQEILISHNGEHNRLRITKSCKLFRPTK